MAGKTYTLRVMYAVIESELPADVRHLVLTLAVLANSSSGEAWYGQTAIAKAMGVSERHVRRLEAELEQIDGPVSITRRRHGPKPSEWKLVLSSGAKDRTAKSGQDRTVPSGHAAEMTGQVRHLDRTSTTKRPDHPVLRSSEDRRSDRRNTNSASELGPGSWLTNPTPEEPSKKQAARRVKPSTAKKPKPERTPEERAAFTKIRDAYFAAFEEKTGEKPHAFDGGDGNSVYRLLTKCKGDADLAVRYVRNAVLSDFGGSTSIHVIAKDPKQFAVMKKREGNGVRPNGRNGPPQTNTGTFDAREHELRDE